MASQAAASAQREALATARETGLRYVADSEPGIRRERGDGGRRRGWVTHVTFCSKCYVHPAVVDSYLDGPILETLRGHAESELKRRLARLESEEAVLSLLQQRLKREAKTARRRKAA